MYELLCNLRKTVFQHFVSIDDYYFFFCLLRFSYTLFYAKVLALHIILLYFMKDTAQKHNIIFKLT